MSTLGLCQRCEHRMRYVEGTEENTVEQRLAKCEKRKPVLKHVPCPRMECGAAPLSNWSCYMYMPILPFVMESDDGDPRSLELPIMLCGRSHARRVAMTNDVGMFAVRREKGGLLRAWIPTEVLKILQRKGDEKSGRKETKRKAKKRQRVVYGRLSGAVG